MVARRLRLILLAELVALFGFGWWLCSARGWGAGEAAAICVGLFLAVNSLVPLITGALALGYGAALSPEFRPRFGQALRAAVLDAVAFFALFLILQPFPRFWMKPGRGRASGASGPVALLIHGYQCNHALWWWFARRLQASGMRVATIDLEPPFAGLDELEEGLRRRLDEMAAAGDREKVILIGHSMGGLVARAHLQRCGAARVAGLITIGTPHAGTALSYLGLCGNARDMREDGAWLRRLAEGRLPPVPVVNIWSAADTFILPQDNARLSGAREHILPDLGHLSLVLSPRVLRIVLDEICRGAVASKREAVEQAGNSASGALDGAPKPKAAR